jgi:hypothetical protein
MADYNKRERKCFCDVSRVASIGPLRSVADQIRKATILPTSRASCSARSLPVARTSVSVDLPRIVKYEG